MTRKATKILVFLLTLCLAFCAFAACDKIADNSAQNTQNANEMEYTPKSGSMAPTLEMGKSYRFLRADAEMTFAVDDIVLVNYYMEATAEPVVVPRRIVAIEEVEGLTIYKMKGDANPFQDDVNYVKNDILAKFIG